jgi:hypothetical protein
VRTRAVLISLVLILACAGCGYNFRATGEPVGVSFTSLAIPLFESTSADRGFEAEFTEIVRNEFISRSKMPLVSKDQAGAVLSGRISEINTQPLTYNSVRQTVNGNTVNYETVGSRKLIIRLSITMKEASTGKTIWRDDSMEETADFKASDDPVQNRYNMDQAVRSIASLMARRIYQNAMERF